MSRRARLGSQVRGSYSYHTRSQLFFCFPSHHHHHHYFYHHHHHQHPTAFTQPAKFSFRFQPRGRLKGLRPQQIMSRMCVTTLVALVWLAPFCSCSAVKKLRKPTLAPSPAPTVTPEPTFTYRPTSVPSISGQPTKEQTPFPSITPAFTLPVGAERKLISIFLPIGCAVLGMLVAAYLFIRDGRREKIHKKYLVGLEADREKYREEVIKKKSESPGWLWGKTHKDLDDKALAIIEEEVLKKYPDDLDHPPDYGHTHIAVVNFVLKWYQKAYFVVWRLFLQGDIEKDYDMENRANSARAALLGSNPTDPAAALDETATPAKSSPVAQEEVDDNDSKGEMDELSGNKSPTDNSAEGAPAHKHHAAIDFVNPLRKQGSFGDNLLKQMSNLASPIHKQGSLGQSAALDATQSAVGGEADDASGEVLGFPKDCGPREGVLILSYKRAMHVRAMNHPHLSFERRGKNQKWRCTTDGFFDTKITDCITSNRLPTPESEKKERDRAAKRREKWLIKSGVENNEVKQIVASEFPPVDPYAPVYYIVSFPLDYDIGMHACVPFTVGCGISDCQRAVGCLDPKPLEEPLAQYGLGIMLYFKFQKAMIHYFAAYAVLASVALYFNYEGSGYSPELKNSMIEQSGLSATVFFTTLGSWSEKNVQCRSENEGSSFSLECPTGVFTSVEAYYGQPTGTCSCPVEQQVDSEGECPADPSYDRYSWGECASSTTSSWSKNATNVSAVRSFTTTEEYCLRGYTPYGSVCCAHRSTGTTHMPDFSDLLPADKAGCHSQSVQYVANARCLGQKNCTLDVSGNHTYEWDIETISVLGNDIELGCGGDSNALNCSVTLNQGNFSECDPKYGIRKNGKYKMFVVGTCWSNTMTVNGHTYSKKNVAMTFAYLDAFMIAVLMLLVDWVKRRELDEVEEHDASRCTAADFTVRILELPVAYSDSDVDALRKELTDHLEKTVLATLPGKHHEPPVPSRVVDINFGYDDQSVLRAKQKRGMIARKLDLAMTRARLLESYGTHKGSSNKSKKAAAIVRALSVSFQEQCKILETAPARKVRTAFVTFETRRMRDECQCLYQDRGWFTGLCQRKGMYFEATDEDMKKKCAGFTIKTVLAPEPDNLVWENLGLNLLERVLRLFLSLVFTFVFLVVCFSLVVVAKTEQMRMEAEIPVMDCTPYTVKPFDVLNYTKIEQGPYYNYKVNNSLVRRPGTGYTYEPGEWEDIITPQRILEDQNYLDYNLTEGNTGLVACFCSAVAYETGAGCTDAFGTSNGKCGVEKMYDFDFVNKAGEVRHYCEEWALATAQLYSITYGMIAAVLAINVFLKILLKKFVEIEAPESETARIVSLTIKLFLALLMNTALIVLVIQGNIQSLTGGSTIVDQALRNVDVMQGSFGDFSAGWYFTVGSAIAITMLGTVIAPQINKVVTIFSSKLAQCQDRGCRSSKHVGVTHRSTQHDLEELYLGPEMSLELMYADFLNQFFVCLMFNAGMPVLTIIFFCFVSLTYFFDKVTFLRLYRLPPAFDATAALATTSILGYAVVLHLLFAIWMYSNPDIFELQSFFNVGEATSTLMTETITTFAPFNASNATNGTNITLNANKHGFIYDLPSTYPNTSNATGIYTSENSSYYQENLALADVGDSLAAVSEFQIGARIVQSVQTAAYLPLLAIFLISWSVVTLGNVFPRCKKDVEEVQLEKIAMLAAEKKDAEDAAAAARVALQEAKESSEADAPTGEGDDGVKAPADGNPRGSGEKGEAGNEEEPSNRTRDRRSTSMERLNASVGRLTRGSNDKDDYESIKAAVLAAKLEALTHDIKKADERAQQMAIALRKSEGLDDLKYYESLPTNLLESRLALNQLDEMVLQEYQLELNRRRLRTASQLLSSQDSAVGAVAEVGSGGPAAEKLRPDKESVVTSPPSPTANGEVGATVFLDGLETYNMAGNQKHVERYGLDSASMVLYSKGKLKVDMKLYLEDLQNLSHSGPIACLKGYLLSQHHHLEDSFPRPDVEIETLARRPPSEVDKPLGRVNQTGAVARTLSVLGVPSHKTTGPMVVLNLPVPLDLFEPTPSSTLHSTATEMVETHRFVTVDVPGLGYVRICLPKGVGSAGVPEIQLSIPAVDVMFDAPQECCGGCLSCFCLCKHAKNLKCAVASATSAVNAQAAKSETELTSQDRTTRASSMDLPATEAAVAALADAAADATQAAAARKQERSALEAESRKAHFAKKYKTEHAIVAQEYTVFAPEEVVLEARVPVLVNTVGRMFAKWPYKAKEGAELRFHLPGISKGFHGHFPDYSIMRPTLGPDGKTATNVDFASLKTCGWATVVPEMEHGLYEATKKDMEHGGVSKATKKKRHKMNKAKAKAAKVALAEAKKRNEAGGEDDDAATAEAGGMGHLKSKDRSIHLQVEAFCPQPVLKSFHDAPLWQTLGECAGRPSSLEASMPGHAAVLVLRHRADAFLGASVRVKLSTNPMVALHGQRATGYVPGACLGGGSDGKVNFAFFAEDVVLTPGVHGRLVATRGFLPWPADWEVGPKSGLAHEQLVPYLDECFVDYPAVPTGANGDGEKVHERRLSGVDLEESAAKGVSRDYGCCKGKDEAMVPRRRSSAASLAAAGVGAEIATLEGHSWATGKLPDIAPPKLRAALGELLPDARGDKAVYDGVQVKRQEYLVVANKHAEYKHGSGKHWLSQEHRLAVPLLGHLHAVFPPQTLAGSTHLNFELPAITAPKPNHWNTPEARRKAQPKKSSSQGWCCAAKVQEEIAYQVGWACCALPSWAHKAVSEAQGDSDGEKTEHPPVVLLLPLMVPHDAWKRSEDNRIHAVAALRKACKMPHVYPHKQHTAASPKYDSPKTAGSTKTTDENSDSDSGEDDEASSGDDNTKELMHVLAGAIKGAAIYRGRDRDVSVGNARFGGDSTHPGDRKGLMVFALQRLECLKQKYPQYCADLAPVPPEAALLSGPPSSAAVSLAGAGAANVTAAPLKASSSADAVLEAAAMAGGMNPLTTPPTDELGMFDAPDSPTVTTKPKEGPVDGIKTTEVAAAAGDGSPKDFASFLFSSPADPKAKLEAAAAVAPSRSAASKLFAAAKAPGSKSKGWNMIRAAYVQSLAAHHEKSTQQLESEQAKLKAFLETCNLSHKYSAFHDLGVDSVTDAVDDDLLSTETLTNDIGLNSEELVAFQDKAKAARAVGKMTAMF